MIADIKGLLKTFGYQKQKHFELERSSNAGKVMHRNLVRVCVEIKDQSPVTWLLAYAKNSLITKKPDSSLGLLVPSPPTMANNGQNYLYSDLNIKISEKFLNYILDCYNGFQAIK